ncbi:MAG: DUF3102 domain-containing protein [Desulfitobacteriaceae bacterium]
MGITEDSAAAGPAVFNAKSQTFANLSYSQAVIFLGIPENEREEFLAAHDIENMSVRELQNAVKERDQALQDREQAFQEKDGQVKGGFLPPERHFNPK